jgi:hypothetical protein
MNLAFIHISWHSFLTGIVVLLAVYYLAIGVLYYRREFLAFFMRTPAPVLEGSGEGMPERSVFEEEPIIMEEGFDVEQPVVAEVAEETPDNAPFPVAYRLSEAIRNLLASAARKHMIREELLQALRSLLHSQQYLSLHGTPLTAAINRLIESETLRQCGFQLGTEDMKMLWAQ